MSVVDDTIRTFLAHEALPPEAVTMFGHEVEDAWNADDQGTEPIVIAVTNDHWRAGLFLLIERIGRGPGTERVASIRQLIVEPASRGRGLAGWLLRRAHTVAVEMDCQRIRSTAGWGCPDHLAMYDRLGYQRSDNDAEQPYLVSRTL